jgi:hypothetical protein
MAKTIIFLSLKRVQKAKSKMTSFWSGKKSIATISTVRLKSEVERIWAQGKARYI